MRTPRAALVETLWQLDGKSEDEGWGNLPPTLFVALEMPPESAERLLSAHSNYDAMKQADDTVMGAVAMTEAPLWRDALVMVDGDTTAAIGLLAFLYSDRLRASIPADISELPSVADLRPPFPLAGVIFTSEVWMVRHPVDGELVDGAPPPSEHPERFDARITVLVTPDGEPPAFLYHERDGIAEIASGSAAGLADGRLTRALALYAFAASGMTDGNVVGCLSAGCEWSSDNPLQRCPLHDAP